MIYLAETKEGSFERIQVVRKRIVCGDYSFIIWGALNHIGTEELVPFSKENVNHEGVLSILLEKYGMLRLSKRKVDNGEKHIICINRKYYLCDDYANCLEDFGVGRATFSTVSDEIQTSYPQFGFPDYYEEVQELPEPRLWLAYDIDLGEWICFSKDGRERTILARAENKYAAFDAAKQKLS